MLAYILLDVDQISLARISRQLESIKEIKRVDCVFGEFNMLIHANVKRQEALDTLMEDRIKCLNEVRHSKVFVER